MPSHPPGNTPAICTFICSIIIDIIGLSPFSISFNVDNKEGGIIPKLKRAALKVMRVNARNKATKRISECSMLSERALDKSGMKEHECAVEGNI